MEFLGIILGFFQGLFEWLPVSSEGQLVLILVQLFGISTDTATALALFAHIGTGLVVILYYRHDFLIMITGTTQYLRLALKSSQTILQPILGAQLFKNFLITTISTIPTALLSLVFFEDLFNELSNTLSINANEIVMLMIGVFLIITGFILKARSQALKEVNVKLATSEANSSSSQTFEQMDWKLAVLLGLLQGFAAIPGISRSAITITFLMIGAKLNQNESIRGSFIVAVPVSIGAGLLEIIRGKLFLLPSGVAGANQVIVISYLGVLSLIATAFIVGYLVLDLFIKVANKLPFDYFMIGFGVLAVLFVTAGFVLQNIIIL